MRRITLTLPPGPGLLESAYQAVLAKELQKRGLTVAQQHPIPILYKDLRIEIDFRADLIVENSVIVELNSIAAITPVHKKQLLTYLRLADKRLGLLINFNVALIQDGITRIANGFKESSLAKARRAFAFSSKRLPSNTIASAIFSSAD